MKKKIFSTRFEPATVKPRNLDREREREKEERERGRDFEGVIYCFCFFLGGGSQPSTIFNFSFSKK